MKQKKERPQFFAIYKDFNSGKIEKYDVLNVIFNTIFTERGTFNTRSFHYFDKKCNVLPVRTKEQLEEFIKLELRYHFWGKCEWEFIAIDWPNRDTIDESRPVKIDVYEQLEPNISVITDLVWNYIEPKLQKLIKKENEQTLHRQTY